MSVSTLIEYAEAALQLWEDTPGVSIEVTYGQVAAEEAYRKAPELVGELVAALKAPWNSPALEDALTKAIEQWMEVASSGERYAHGNAQGIARSLALLKGTSFEVEWVAGLDRYQNKVVRG
jgi:hypothetical protein